MKDGQSNINNTDELDDIRAEYKEAKKKIERYDTFIDNNQLAIVFLFILLAISGIVTAGIVDNGKLARSGLLYASIAMFPIGIVFAIISGARQSSKKRLEQKIEKLRREVALFQKHSGGAQAQQHVARDELGLYDDIKAGRSTNHVAIGVLVIVVVLAAIITPVMIAQGNAAREETARKEEQAKQEQVQKDSRDRYYQQQQDAINSSQNQNNTTSCISNEIGSTFYTNCY